MNIQTHTRQKRAFTLIEILVVIAIISLLAAILFPVFGRARENARRSSCASNMKQLGLGLAQYYSDFDERMPLLFRNSGGSVVDFVNDFNDTSLAPQSNAYRALLTYIGNNTQILACPSAPATTGSNPPTAKSNSSYLINGAIIERPISVLQFPAELIFMQESNFRTSRAESRPSQISGTAGLHVRHWTIANSDGHPQYSRIHFDGGNLLYCDGHVKFQANSSLKASMFGLRDANPPICPATSGSSTVTGTPSDTSYAGMGKVYCRVF